MRAPTVAARPPRVKFADDTLPRGWLTAGNRRAAQDVWGLVDGRQYLQPELM
jgi:hypothetical protein